MCPAFLAPAVIASPNKGRIKLGQHHPATMEGIEMIKVNKLIQSGFVSPPALRVSEEEIEEEEETTVECPLIDGCGAHVPESQTKGSEISDDMRESRKKKSERKRIKTEELITNSLVKLVILTS